MSSNLFSTRFARLLEPEPGFPHVATEILPFLYLGDLQDAVSWRGFCVNVLETRSPSLPPSVVHVSIFDPVESRAIFGRLEQVADLIDPALKRRERVLVSCGQGIERSPLAVVWYLFRKKGMSVSAAYALVREKRPIVQERLEWLHGPGFPRWW